ncbi:SoxR reducing system RseC family protein [Anaerococcus sp.]|uniref:SoxR reducing system RseC family protein n=1 Tax=Anaerococcus sp. TaxID=1872515 RepID=UPI0028FEDACF|nr:SoxR reducing system RseC family protein [Anaerococcus sp.]MDU2598471.1 SoxR reducing system RseC family protein [Anaerococcus sp.]MDU5228985.1 SoxR reducing system RseC family protein [Anaerococcus sp.]
MTQMIKLGKVLENNNGHLVVSVARNEACGSCAAKGTCGKKEETIIEVYSTEDVKVGDNIIIESRSSDITKYSIYVYVLPVVMMVIGAVLPSILFKNTGYDINLITLLSVIVFFAISFIIIKAIDKNLAHQNVMKVRKV